MFKSYVAGKNLREASHIGIFVACAFLIAIIAAFILVMNTASQINDYVAEAETTRFSKAVHNTLDAAKVDLALIAAGMPEMEASTERDAENELHSHFMNNPWAQIGFTSSYLINANGKIIFGQDMGLNATQPLYELIKPFLATLISEASEQQKIDTRKLKSWNGSTPFGKHGTSRIIDLGQRIVIAVAVPVQLVSKANNRTNVMPTTTMMVGIQDVSSDVLKSIAEKNGLVDFRVERAVPITAGGAIGINNIEGSASVFLTWSPDRPGDNLFWKLATIICLFTLFIFSVFGIAFIQLRKAMVELTTREETIGRIAAYDELSGLHNRRSFEMQLTEHAARISRSGGSMAVLFLDLDRFKAVNDLHGHKVGDELIRSVARRLRELVRGGDCVARLGGDEFAIIQSEISNPRDGAQLGQRIIESLREPFEINDVEVSIGVSIGIALFPTDSAEKDALVRMADTALYQAKNEGRNRFCFFEREMDRSMQMSRIVADDLRSAIENDELVLHYQPQISADGEKVFGVEALVRWQHPIHGMIPPNDFISIAEQRGLIVPLSQWVLRRACLDMKRWPDLRLAVNISPVDFRNPEFVSNVSAIIAETGFDATRLELELTEGVVVEDADSAEQAMMELRGLGIGLALDDFGTGYSSLIYLRRFAFDKIKIDRSFLEYMETTGESAILVHSVVHLGRALGLRVCAEGVETAEQHRFLQAVGCHELQGYFFSRPIPLVALSDFIAAKLALQDEAA